MPLCDVGGFESCGARWHAGSLILDSGKRFCTYIGRYGRLVGGIGRLD